MNLHVSSSALSSALAGLVPLAQGTTPAHAAVLLTAEDGAVRLSAGVRMHGWVRVPATVAEPGTVAVNAVRLAAVVKAGGGDVVTIRSGKNYGVVVECGGSYALAGDNPDDVPAPATFTPDGEAEVPGADMATALGLVTHAMSGDDNRYGLCVAHLEPNGTVGRIVTTDGQRLAYAPLAVTVARAVDVPRSLVLALVRLLGDDAVVLSWSAHRFAAAGASWGLSTARTVVDFPDYRAVLPTGDAKQAVKLPAAELAAALNRVRPLAGGAMMVKALFSDDGVTLMATSVDNGTATATVPAEVTGKPKAMGFNLAYLAEALRAFGSADVTLRLHGQIAPVLITSDAHPDALQVVMPVRLD